MSIDELVGKIVYVKVPVRDGFSRDERKCRIISLEEASYEEAGINGEDWDNQPFYKVTFKICSGEKGAGRKFVRYYPLELLKTLF